VADTYGKPCSTEYKAVHHGGPRRPSEIGWIVIHSTEGATAQGAARWFTNPQSGGSANLVIDDKHCFRTVDDLTVPWGAPPLNQRGFHIECAGYAAWTKQEWLKHTPELRRAAWKTAQRCVVYKIPVRQVGWIGLRIGRKGITSHNAVSKAWHQTDHHDPGTGFPWTVFMSFVEQYTREG
jgi:N-acetyl-anhydromuramyl-L-alanine amidase AmpD